MKLFDLFRRPDFGALLEQANLSQSPVIDVRTVLEYRQGHVPGSINIPLDDIGEASFDPSKTLYLYCRSGARSANACAQLTRKGYQAINMGGILAYRGPLER